MKKGFTLIELLVVITILAVLAGAALPYVQNYVDESRQAKVKADLEEIARALVVYETREGEYNKADVSDLTGRYLNKSPIDPWGSAYVVNPSAGNVFSKGPDRKHAGAINGIDDTEIVAADASATDENNYDDVNFSYQPPLALVSVKWVDKNQSGAVDTQNVADELHLTFSRRIAGDLKNVINDLRFVDETGVAVSPITDLTSQAAGAAPYGSISSKILIYQLGDNKPRFVAGRDAIMVTRSAGITVSDMAQNKCLTEQAVRILAQ